MSDQELSAALVQALGLNAKNLNWARLRLNMGLHQPPEQILAIMKSYTDGLALPRLPQWEHGVLSSRHSTPFLDMEPIDQQRTRVMRQSLFSNPMPTNWVDALRYLQLKYPDVPVLYNLEVMYYRVVGDYENWHASAESLLERFPGYLFAVCSLASYYLTQNDPDKVPGLFNYQLDLQDFDPDEGRVFEASEVSAFYGVMAWYHLFESNLLRSAFCISLIHAAKPQDPFLDKLMSWLLQLPDEVLLRLRQILNQALA